MTHIPTYACGARQLETIDRYMTRDVISVAPNALIEEALDVMLGHEISGLPVIDDARRLVGVLSEFDALKLLLDSPEETGLVVPVAHYMSTDVLSVPENAPLATVVHIFRDTGVRRLPVVRDGRVVGILSRRDLIRVVRQRRQEEGFESLASDEDWRQWLKSR